MKSKVVAGLVVAGVLGISGAALAAEVNVNAKFDDLPKYAANTQSRKQPPEFKQGERPSLPPKGAHSGDKRPPELNGKRPPMSGDKRPPRPSMSEDKKPDGKRPPKRKSN